LLGTDFLFEAAIFFAGAFLAGNFLGVGTGVCILGGLGDTGMLILGVDLVADADFSLPHWLRLCSNTSGMCGSTPP